MRLWFWCPGETVCLPIQFRARHTCLILSILLTAMVIGTSYVTSATDPMPVPVQRSGKTPTPLVGSAMAVLATFEQAHVLPPEGTPEANRIIQSVIQFQSAFTKSDDPTIQDFAARAVTARQGERAVGLLAQARATGWTSELLDALAEAEARTPTGDLQKLGAGLGRYNMSLEDFHQFMGLIRDARNSLAKRGLDFHQVYAAHRNNMPGAKTFQ